MWQENNRCTWLMSTYSSISSLLIEDQPYVIMKEDKLLPVYFFFFSGVARWIYSGNSVKECKEWPTFFQPCTQNNTLKAKRSIYCSSSWEIFDTARKLWAEFLLEHLLCLLVDNIIKGPFIRVILHLSWDDASHS